MYRVHNLAAVVLLLVLLSPALAATDNKPDKKQNGERKLAFEIEQILRDDPEAARGFWGIDAVSLDTGKPIYALNQDKLFTPASNTKLFTTAAVFGLIGPDYRFKTTVETTGTLDKYGRLNADLVLVGRGDPNLSGRTLPYSMHTERKTPPIQVLQSLADQLVQQGLKYIDGDVVADDSYYVFERYGEGWSQDDLAREWGAPVSALTINDNVIFVNIMPADRPGERAFLNITPFPEYYKIDNRVMTTPQGTGPRTVSINREPGSNQLTFWGNIPLDDPGFGEALAIEDPADFAARLFRELLEERGVTIYGRARTHHTELASTQTFSVTSMASGGGDATRPPNPAPLVLASYQSQPVAENLRVINKVSQNLHAELMLRLLGKEKGTSGSIEGGLEVPTRLSHSRGDQAGPIRLFGRLGAVTREPGHSRCGGCDSALQSPATLGTALPGDSAHRRCGWIALRPLSQHTGCGSGPCQNGIARARLFACGIRHHAARGTHRVFHHDQQRHPACQESARHD